MLLTDKAALITGAASRIGLAITERFAQEGAGTSVEEAIQKAHQNYGVPEGVARVIGFMLSDEADYLRGALFTR